MNSSCKEEQAVRVLESTPVRARIQPRRHLLLQGAANLLGMAIERERYERSLKTALERQQVLLKEITHRSRTVSLSWRACSSSRPRSERSGGDPAARRSAYRVRRSQNRHERIHQADVRTSSISAGYVKDFPRSERPLRLAYRGRGRAGIMVLPDRAVRLPSRPMS